MDRGQYSTRMDVLAAIPDPRKPRGKRHVWLRLLTVLVAGLASGDQGAQAMAQWAKLPADERRQFLPDVPRIPSASTLLRTVRQIDGDLLDRLVALYPANLPTAPDQASCLITRHGEVLQGQARDGKTGRGASAPGDKTHLVSLVQPGRAVPWAQTEVAIKQNAISAPPPLLRARDLLGTVTTGDALLTQRTIAQPIPGQGGPELLIVKRNQRQLWDDLDLLFRIPAIPADQEEGDQVTTIPKGHGRIETCTLECGTGLVDVLAWPGVAQVVRRTWERRVVQRGKRTVERSDGITSLPPPAAGAAHREAVWRGPWTIENRTP
jgi:hypothetical protein